MCILIKKKILEAHLSLLLNKLFITLLQSYLTICIFFLFFDIIEISYLDRFSSQMLTFINPYVWPNGSPPPNYRPHNSCPFDNYHIQSSSKGKTALYAFSSFFIIISLASCILTYFKCDKKTSQITDKKYISFEDYIFFLTFLYNFFKY